MDEELNQMVQMINEWAKTFCPALCQQTQTHISDMGLNFYPITKAKKKKKAYGHGTLTTA